MMRADHQSAFEDLMADLDGQLTPAESAAVRAHVAGCQECQGVEAELRGVAARMAKWTVEAPPASLKSPVPASRIARMRSWLPIAAAVVVAAGAGSMWLSNPLKSPAADSAVSARLTMEAPGAAAELSYTDALSADSAPASAVGGRTVAGRANVEVNQEPAGAPLLTRTARLTLLVTDFDAARAEMERIISGAGGFVGNVRISDERGSARLLNGSMRVPQQSLDRTLDQLRRLGKVRREGKDAEDVTQQSADLDARLANARNSEKRLNDILANRTGDLSDVLEAEREITRVRGEIERMEAARRMLDRRITFATIEIEMAEEQKAALDLGEQSVAVELQNALVGGWNSAFNSALNAALLIAWAAPTLLLWGLALGVPYWLFRRRIAR